MSLHLPSTLFLRPFVTALAFAIADCSAPPDQKAAKDTPWITEGYKTIRNDNSNLDELAKSVALIHIFTSDGTKQGGSAVLIDKFGTLALTYHQHMQTKDGKLKADFVDLKNGTSSSFEAKVDYFDKSLDLAFATITSPLFFQLLKENKIEPISWGQTAIYDGVQNKSAIFAGFPLSAKGALHVNEGVQEYFTDRPNRGGFSNYVICQMEGTGVVPNGMSGGSVFGNKKFQGLINASNEILNTVEFTPSEAVYEAYRISYPIRATSQQQPPNLKNLPPSCTRYKITALSH